MPIAFVAMGGLADRGLTLAKPLGLLLVGYLTWILSAAHILPAGSVGPLVVFAALAAVSAAVAYWRRGEIAAMVRQRWRALLAAEAVFLAVFAAWTLYRAFDPAISHTEQPMDLALLSASMRADFAPPEDPWLRGEGVSYYYFGFWMMGGLANLTGAASPVAYNLALSLVPAMAAAGAVGLVYNLVSADGGRTRVALLSGLLAAVLLVAAANLEGVLEFMRANALGSDGFWGWIAIDGLDGPAPQPAEGWRPGEFWWWWRASRVINTFEGGQGIDFTIQEFPFFSALLGDLHPHFMSLPFVILFLGLCVSFLSARSPRPADTRHLGALLGRAGPAAAARSFARGFAPGGWRLALLALALGGLGFTNAWDLPVFAAIFLAVVALRALAARGPSPRDIAADVLTVGAVVIGLAFLLYLPYFGSFQSQFSGIRPVAEVTTRPIHFLIVWGLLFVAVAPMVVSAFWGTRIEPGWRRLALPALAAGFGPLVCWIGVLLWGRTGEVDVAGRFFSVLPLSALISLGAYSALWSLGDRRRGGPRVGLAAALALATFGMLLTLGPELVYVGDHFGTRMNTVFKFYYQAWVLFALAGGFALHHWAGRMRAPGGPARALAAVWAAAFCALLIASLYYPAAAIASKPDPSAGPRGLDGLAHLASADERGAIEFLRDSAGPESAVLEAVGGSYTEFGRISAATGVPTVLGWPGHEVQWRGSAGPLAGREDDVRTIYQSPDALVAENLLGRYGVDYVYVGPRERRAYGTDGLGKFEEFMDRVYSTETVVIYRMPEADG